MDTILSHPLSCCGDATPITSSPYLASFRVARYCFLGTHTFDNRFGTPYCSIGYVLKGRANFESDREHFELESGDIVYVPKGERYVSNWRGSPEIEYCSIHFMFNPDIKTNDEVASIRRYKLQKTVAWDNSLRGRFDELYALYTAGGNSMFTAIGEFYLLYRDIVKLLACEELSTERNPVQPAINFIELHSSENFRVADLAALCFMSESRFYSVFHRYTGCSPIEYKNRIRIQQSIMLLSDRDNTVERISSLLNFSSPAYFRRMFKQVTGKTPHESRYLL